MGVTGTAGSMEEPTTPFYKSPVKIHKYCVDLHETDLKHNTVGPRKSYLRASALRKVCFCQLDLTITYKQREEGNSGKDRKSEPPKVSFAQCTWRTRSYSMPS